MRNRKSPALCAAALCLCLCFTSMQMGYAAWQTRITASSGATIASDWSISVTDAELTLSDGASAEPLTEDGALARTEGDSVAFADVTFAQDGAWAEYSLTVANSGDVAATLDGSLSEMISLSGSDQLSLRLPDVSDATLAAGESCTITFVVQAEGDPDGDSASAALVVDLCYSQAEVGGAPDPTYTLS